VPDAYRWIVLLNPMTGVVQGFRAALLGQPWDFMALASSAGVTLLLLVLGVTNFRRSERRFADVA
jgi:lipopolysaccharide transport system permease protein